MRHTESKANKVFENVAALGIGVPVVGLLMGGIYSMPAMHVCKGREPWLSVSLSIGLAITVFGLGYLTDTPILFSVGAWGFSVILLLVARRLYGTLDGNLERFGLVHAAALLIAFVLALLTAHGISRNA
ncbi:MAG: hypothetical protein OEW90_11775 [Betaproteobacteria bacterium]|nr:hypothetical protein [Betaproteobacteria bacterium]